MKHLRSPLLISVIALAACQGDAPVSSPDQASAPAAAPDTSQIDYAASGWLAKSLPDLSQALENGELTSAELVQAYLDRIAAIDRAGPTLQSVLTVNPEAMAEAERLDELRASGEILGPLHGLPILLKDNIESQDDIPTTAGALALRENVTGRDSPLVAGLRAQGAIILGKTNLSQWANFRSESSMSGWSALGGQVRNPRMLDRNPCGSSSGSGAAMAASLAAGTVGTETNGSIICPSNANGIVGFKPTVGLVPQDYIIPISSTQDTAGPMTKTVRGAAMMLSAMSPENDTDFAAQLDAESLSGARVGVLRYAQGSNADIIERFNAAVADIENLGAEIIEIESFSPDMENFGQRTYDLLKYEFKATLNDYLENSPADIPVRSLEDLIIYNQNNAGVELALFDQSIFDASDEMGSLEDEDYVTTRDDMLEAMRAGGIDKIMADNNLDVMISPSGPVPGRIDPINGDVWPSWAGAGSLAARAGYPHLTVPMGDIHGLSIGLSFFGGADEDAQVLSYGYAYEQATQHLSPPQYYKTAEDRPEIRKAMGRMDP